MSQICTMLSLLHVASRPAVGGGVIMAERGIPADVIATLEKRDHRVDRVPTNSGSYQAILLDPKTGVVHGGTEARKDGCAGGINVKASRVALVPGGRRCSGR